VRDPRGQRKRIPNGNVRVKLPNYIGQVFECKADNTYSWRRYVVCYDRNLAAARDHLLFHLVRQMRHESCSTTTRSRDRLRLHVSSCIP
jgi:hypothetical protein